MSLTTDELVALQPRVETSAFAAFVRRIIRAHGRRVGSGDPEALRDLVALRDELNTAIDHAANELHEGGFSWAEIARPLGVARQSVYERHRRARVSA